MMRITKSLLRFLFYVCFFFAISGCSNNIHHETGHYYSQHHTKNLANYRVRGKSYHVLSSSRNYQEKGYASWYGKQFHHKRTSSGERYNMYHLTAAHKTLPLATYVKVTNLKNGRHVVVKINDRGPFVSNRLIDLSYAAAKKIGMVGHGLVPVRVVAVHRG